MFRISRRKLGLAEIDLSTMREALAFMKRDAGRVPGLESLGLALDAALDEVDQAERKLAPPVLSPAMAKFLPHRRI